LEAGEVSKALVLRKWAGGEIRGDALKTKPKGANRTIGRSEEKNKRELSADDRTGCLLEGRIA